MTGRGEETQSALLEIRAKERRIGEKEKKRDRKGKKCRLGGGEREGGGVCL